MKFWSKVDARPLLFAACSKLSNDVERRCKEINFLSWLSGRFGTPPPQCLWHLSNWELLYEHMTSKSTVPCLLRAFFHDICPVYEYLCCCLHFLHILILIFPPPLTCIQLFHEYKPSALWGNSLSLMKVASKRSSVRGYMCVCVCLFILGCWAVLVVSADMLS